MTPEERLADFVSCWPAADVPDPARDTVRLVAMASLGAGIAGSGEDGVESLHALLRRRGGAPEATALVFGDCLPATAAAQLGGTLCRALDFCDAMAPGPHFGSAMLPAALAAAELASGCSGAEFVAALAVGAELGARFNLQERQYDGFDPTGVAAVFAATGAVARVLRLDPPATLHALALAFNRCGGSFQSHVDGSLAVRAIEGWVAETGIVCAQMAQAGFTGPRHFLAGHYGYAHLFGRDRLDPAQVVADLGRDWRLRAMMFKPYPSCGATQGPTELVLGLVRDLALRPDEVSSLTVTLPPYAHRLVGHAWQPGENLRVDAQFSVRYCAANALLRRGSTLQHFRPDQVADPALLPLIERVVAVADPALDARGHTACEVELVTRSRGVHRRGLDIAPGFPGRALSEAQQRARWQDCMAYAPRPLPEAPALLARLQDLAALADVRTLLPLLVAR